MWGWIWTFRIARGERLAREEEARRRREEEARTRAQEQQRRDGQRRLKEEEEARERAEADDIRLQKQVRAKSISGETVFFFLFSSF